MRCCWSKVSLPFSPWSKVSLPFSPSVTIEEGKTTTRTSRYDLPSFLICTAAAADKEEEKNRNEESRMKRGSRNSTCKRRRRSRNEVEGGAEAKEG